MKLYFTFIILALLGLNVQAQELNGKVIDLTTNLPLKGATVKNNDAKKAITNDQGEFTLPCSNETLLTISYVGYADQLLKVTDCNQVLTVRMIPSTEELKIVDIFSAQDNQEALETASSAIDIDSNAINRGTGLFLTDAINTSVPGVYMQSRSSSGGQQFNIRGYGNGLGFKGANNNFDGQGSKVYLNGIPITDAEGITVMDDIDFGSVEKVNIEKGPAGTLYGLAIAGAVNFQTQKAAKNSVSVGQDLLVGSYGLLRTTTRLAIGGQKSSLLVNYGHQNFDGFMVHTASTKDFVNVMGDFIINSKQSLTTYVGYSNSYDERNGELTANQYANFDYSGNLAYIANNAHSAVRTFRAGISHTYKIKSYLKNTTSFFGSAQNLDNSSAGGWSDKSPLNYGMRSTFDLNFSLSEKVKLNGTVGVEMQEMNALAVGYRMGVDSTNPSGYHVITDLKSIQATTSGTISYFTQWTLQLPADIAVTAGVGISNMKLRLEDRLWAAKNNFPGSTTPQFYETSYTNLVSPSVSVNKKLNDVASVYVSYSTGYKAPVSSQFYIPTTGEVNRGLVPEKGTQVEIGTKGSFFKNRLFYTVAVFNARFTDKMTMVSVQNPENTATLYSYVQNGGDLNNNGLEVLVNYEIVSQKGKFFTSVKPFANFTYSDFKYDNFQYQTVGKASDNSDSTLTFNYDGNRVAGVPPIVFNLGVDASTKIGVYGNVNFNYRDAMFYTSDEANETEAYTLLNAKLGYRKSIKNFNFDLYVGANNITSSQYYYMVFLNQLPDAYIPAPNEINFFGGINLKYTF